jgi:hypothetical protein
MGLFAVPVGVNQRQDTAILGGDFKLFDKIEVETAPRIIERSFLHSSAIKACGYPAGGELVCTEVEHSSHMNFGFIADGFLYPGMSGGPVIDEETGHIIGVNTAVADSHIYLSPTVELFRQVGL